MNAGRISLMTLMNNGRGLSFSDVQLLPDYSTCQSRKQISTATRLVGDIRMDIPLISSNMDTVTERKMMDAMNEMGGVGFPHRFMDNIDQLKMFIGFKGTKVFSIGVKERDFELIANPALRLNLQNMDAFCIDVAHGHCENVKNMIEHIKHHFPDKFVIAGNVCTYQGAYALCYWGADGIKAGVGNGAVCLTKNKTGCGAPQLTAVLNGRRAIDDFWREKGGEYKPTLISDGGVREHGDIVKALVFGADSVMIGSLFAGTEETPGDMIKGKKIYRGMASRGAQRSIGVERSPEGVEMEVDYKGSVIPIVKEMCEDIRSGLSYLGVNSIEELRDSYIRYLEINYGIKR